MATVELIDVKKSFGGVEAVAGISLKIAQGEFVALLGPSGCGKTTTLNLLAGFVSPNAGQLLIDSVSVADIPPHKRNIGIVFQSYALFPHLNVFDNIAFGLRMRKVPPADIAKRVRRALDIVRLDQHEERSIRQLSGGQQQRVALARSLVIEPSLLLLDEPLSNFDATLREQMRFEIREIQKRVRITTVFVTHDQSEAMAAADRLVIMDKGLIRQAGTAQEIYRSPADAFVAGFIGQANLIKVKVKGSDASETRAELSSGDVVSVPSRVALEKDASGIIMLRPEEMNVSSEALPDRQNVRGIVRRVSFLGSSINVGVEVGSEVISILIPGDRPPPREGDQVCVSWKQSAAMLFADK